MPLVIVFKYFIKLKMLIKIKAFREINSITLLIHCGMFGVSLTLTLMKCIFSHRKMIFKSFQIKHDDINLFYNVILDNHIKK